jgi:hypothetical protein
MDPTAGVLPELRSAAFIKLVRIIGLPGMLEGKNSENIYNNDAQLIESASLNKIGLLYSIASNKASKEMVTRNELLIVTLKELSNVFSVNGLRYSIFKTIKPFPTTPSDVDVLVNREDLQRAASLLEFSGFQITTEDAYSITMQRGTMIVDLQLQPSVSNLPYISKEFLMRNIVLKHLDGFDVYNLSDEAEIIVVASHSLYKEQLFTLSDYYTITMLTERVADVDNLIELATLSNTLDALRIMAYLCSQVTEKAFGTSNLKICKLSEVLGAPSLGIRDIQELPLKFPFSLVIRLLISRARKDKQLRQKILPAIMRIVSPTQLGKLISHMTRKTY